MLRRMLLVFGAVSTCAGAALATCGIWQLAAAVQGVLQLTAPVSSPAPAEATGEVRASAAEVASSAPEPAPLPIDESFGLTSATPARHDASEASEKTVSMGADTWPEYVRTECTGVFVYIVTTSVDSPLDSTASLGWSRTGRARLRRAGQMVGDWEVLGITDDWSGLNPAVWLVKDHEVCRAELAGNPARVHVALKPPVKKPKKRKRRRRGKRR